MYVLFLWNVLLIKRLCFRVQIYLLYMVFSYTFLVFCVYFKLFKDVRTAPWVRGRFSDPLWDIS